MSTTELDSVIHYVKNEFSNMLCKRKDLIIQLGDAYEKVVSNPESICEEIKTILHDEIREKLISSRDIERYCPDKWKKKTKPKNDKLSFSNKEPIIIDQQGNPIKNETIETNQEKQGEGDYQNNCENMQKKDSEVSNSWISLQDRTEGTSRVIDVEFSLPFDDVRRYTLKVCNPYVPSRPIWFNVKVDLKTGQVIAAYIGRILDRPHTGQNNDDVESSSRFEN